MSRGAYFDLCLSDAAKRLKRWESSNYHLLPSELELHSWPQTWPDTTCGFGGEGHPALTTTQTVVIIGPCGDACVYHNRFAYYLPHPNAAFWEALILRELPGAVDPAHKRMTR
jgi:hypothetical protein